MGKKDMLDTFIRESKDMLSQMISGSPIPTFVIDRNHKVTHFNKACETLTGIPAREIIGSDQQWRAFYSTKRPVMADIVLDSAGHDGLETFYKGKYRVSTVKPGAYEAEDYFPALGEDGKWLFFTAAPVKDNQGNVIGAIETLQDITREKRVSELNAAMLRISNALHNFSYLEDLLTYISKEIKNLLGAEGALVVLRDPEANELYCPGIAYDDPDNEKRVRTIRFSMDEVVAGQVIQTGKPVIINDTSWHDLYPIRDQKMGYITRSLVEVPVFAEDRIIGVLSGINKKDGQFSHKDVELLSTLAGTVALAIENTRYQEELRHAYREVRALNTAKGKAINHLSHELKTPVAILSEAVSVLEEELQALPEDDWRPFLGMIYRQLHRISDIKDEVADIIKAKDRNVSELTPWLIEQCGDLLSVLASNNMGKGDVAEQIKAFIENLFTPKDLVMVSVYLSDFVDHRIRVLNKEFTHRNIEFRLNLEKARNILIPQEILQKIVDGLIRNAIENTPDEGRVHLSVFEKGEHVFLSVKDSGVGVRQDHQERIFEGFFPTQDMTLYSTRKPFDFNAGGKGADLLRMKIFSEAYNFTIEMRSTRCPHLDEEKKTCPGRISLCPAVTESSPCDTLGGTEFILRF
ncbi:MAG: GAF domain-containing protein [Proteobacteria bacterium]|nr:GAF domain-containing protein [Pseudomonadota bacterium]